MGGRFVVGGSALAVAAVLGGVVGVSTLSHQQPVTPQSSTVQLVQPAGIVVPPPTHKPKPKAPVKHRKIPPPKLPSPKPHTGKVAAPVKVAKAAAPVKVAAVKPQAVSLAPAPAPQLKAATVTQQPAAPAPVSTPIAPDDPIRKTPPPPIMPNVPPMPQPTPSN